jgi:hypothetical protein
LNNSLLAQAIRGIPCSKTILEFQSVCGISSYTTSVELLDFLNRKGIGEISERKTIFSSTDKLNLLILALRNNCDPKLLSDSVNWKDFENFVMVILKKNGYTCNTDIHIPKPRIQIDVIATSGRRVLAIDCKHWRAMGHSKMIESANRQYFRTNFYLKNNNRGTDYGIPIIVTLNEPCQPIVNGVPFVSISRFSSFIKDYELYQNDLCVIPSDKKVKCRT